jgi:hypothetical protein
VWAVADATARLSEGIDRALEQGSDIDHPCRRIRKGNDGGTADIARFTFRRRVDSIFDLE